MKSVYYHSETGIIYQGHVLDVLQGLPDESVQCVVTSPPYWGLRDYKLEPQIWENENGMEKRFKGHPIFPTGSGCDNASIPTGDNLRSNNGVVKCEHEWGEDIQFISDDKPTGKQATSKGTIDRRQEQPISSFCLRCGAWRGSLGLEPTPELFVSHIVQVFREVRRVLRKDGTLFLNLGDSYASSPPGNTTKGVSAKSTLHGVNDDSGRYRDTLSQSVQTKRNTVVSSLKPKDLVGIPWRVAFALQADGWWLRSDIIWSKPNPMPESVTDRPTKSHEYIFLFAKGQWKSRIIKFSDLPSERFHFLKNFGFGSESFSLPTRAAIDFATSLFNFAQSQKQFPLPLFDSEVWQKMLNDVDSNEIRTIPEIHRAAASCYRFLTAHSTTKEFFEHVNSLGITLSDGNQFLVGTASPFKIPLPKGALSDRDGTITINYPSQICKINFLHKTIIIQNPVACQYFWDQEAVREPHQTNDHFRGDGNPIYRADHFNHSLGGRNLRSVWAIATQPYPQSHFATFPEAIPEKCIKAGSKAGDTVLDPFFGAGTVGLIAEKLNRKWIGIELNPDYCAMARDRILKKAWNVEEGQVNWVQEGLFQ